MERTTYRPSSCSTIYTYERNDLRSSAYRFQSSAADVALDDPLPLFLSDPDGQPDPGGELAVPRHRSAARIASASLAISALAILVTLFHSDVTRVLIHSARASIGAFSTNISATKMGSDYGAVRQIPLNQIPLNEPARVSDDTITLGKVDASDPSRPNRDDIISAYLIALQTQRPAAPTTANAAVAPPAKIDAETLTALIARANSLLMIGDIAASRLLLERAADAGDATAAFLLAQTYDPAVLGAPDKRSITPDAELARDWYRKAASFGSADAAQRLTHLKY